MRTVIPFRSKEIKTHGVEKYIKAAKECLCNSVVISMYAGKNYEDTKDECAEVSRACDKFNEAGIETSIWVHPTLELVPYKKHTNLTPLKGDPIKGKCCPLDDEYCKTAAEYVEFVARNTGKRTIVLEDDFRMQFPYLPAACFCEHHMKFYSEYIGKPVTKEDFEKNLFGEPNIYREAWVKGNQAGLVKLAKAIREGVDRVDENIEIVFSTGPANCGSDGTDMFEIIDILKGKHEKATIRLSGGPYWHGGFHLTRNTMTAVNLTRYTSKLCKENGVIGRAEGDVFPRPRHIVPATYLEFFNTALLFDGNAEEILKYMFDYIASPDYETGYKNAHIKNLPVYEKIKALSADKKTVGFYPYEDFSLASYTNKLNPMPEMDVFTSCVREFCTENSLPVSYEAGGVNILFGDRARTFDLSLLKNGSVIDIVCAKALMKMGVDVGIESFGETIATGGREYFVEEDENAGESISFNAFSLKLKEKARIISYFGSGSDIVSHKEDDTIASYLYENADGQKFYVMNFDADDCCSTYIKQGVFNNYCRQRLLEKYYEWLSGKRIDAFCAGNPWLYIMVKKNEEKCVIGLWNFFGDDIYMPEVSLGDTYKKAEFIYCDGKIEEGKAIITSGIDAYKFCFIELTK